MIFAGGVPLKREGKVVGAVGVSGGTGKQDQSVAEAGQPLNQSVFSITAFGLTLTTDWNDSPRKGGTRRIIRRKRADGKNNQHRRA